MRSCSEHGDVMRARIEEYVHYEVMDSEWPFTQAELQAIEARRVCEPASLGW